MTSTINHEPVLVPPIRTGAITPLPRGHGDIQTAVVNLVDRLAPAVPIARQPSLARDIAEVIASGPSSMVNNMFLRQSIIRGGTATHDHVIEGLAAWVTVLFDLGNLQHDRRRALDVEANIPDEALDRLAQVLSKSRNGCILAVPHIGSIELLAAHLIDRGFNIAFVYAIGPECVKTAGHWELTKPASAKVAAFRLRRPERQFAAEHIAKAQQPRTGITPASPS